MNPLKKLALKAAQTVVRSLTTREPDGWYSNDQIGDAGETVTGESALSLSAAWSCVNLIAGTGATLPLMVYQTSPAGIRAVAKDHPLYRVLHDSPNYDQTAVDFWEFMFASVELWGNAYARVDRSAGSVRGLHPVAPQWIVPRRLSNGSIEYRWSEDGRQFVETDRTMLHIRGFGGNPLGGMSTLHFGRHTFSLARATDKAAGATFKNGLRPSGTLTMEAYAKTQDQRDEIEAGLAKKFAGAINAGRPMLLEGGMKWQQLTINPDDAQMLETRRFSVEEICRFFGVPPHMVGHTDKATSWGTGLEQQTLGFQKFTLRRRLKRIEQALEKQLLTPVDRAAGIVIEFNLEGLLRGDSAGRAAYYTAALGDTQKPGWMVKNEVRRLENLEPVEGGDEPVPLVTREAPKVAIEEPPQ